MNRASLRSLRRGPLSERAMITVTSRTRMSRRTIAPAAMMALCCSAPSRVRLRSTMLSAACCSTSRIPSTVSVMASYQALPSRVSPI